MKLSARLAAVAELVPRGSRVIDVGTDHGYLPVYLAEHGLADAIFASDVNRGPLNQARKSAVAAGVSDKITFTLADGLPETVSGEVDTVVIAGMGGETIAGIVERAPWLRERDALLVLQPQTKVQELWETLRANGYATFEVRLVKDAGRIYVIMLARSAASGAVNAPVLELLVKRRDELLGEYLDDMTARATRIRKSLLRTGDIEEARRYEAALNYYDGIRNMMGVGEKVTTVNDVFAAMNEYAPVETKLGFDNVGLLVGRGAAEVTRVLVALDVTSAVIAEAKELGAQVIVSHHPIIFTEKTVTDATINGRKLLALGEAGVAAICMHTNLDAAVGGVNDALACAAGLNSVTLLDEEGTWNGAPYSLGRIGILEQPATLAEYLPKLKLGLGAEGLRYYDAGRQVRKVGLVSGSGGDRFETAVRQGCDTFLSGDLKYDLFLDAAELGVNVIDGGHFCTENLVVPVVAKYLRERFAGVEVRISTVHTVVPSFYVG
ncbi:MAG: Nif3-like dinuclear metal center hexameric protein [Oscillospiraceae bacterium]|nr:Nif3-like dinuclear metal center hexameric protein [Oscillospiraceae bacterium]